MNITYLFIILLLLIYEDMLGELMEETPIRYTHYDKNDMPI